MVGEQWGDVGGESVHDFAWMLAPYTVQDFFNGYWEKQPLVRVQGIALFMSALPGHFTSKQRLLSRLDDGSTLLSDTESEHVQAEDLEAMFGLKDEPSLEFSTRCMCPLC